MKKRNTLQTLRALTLSLVLAVFLATCEGGYQPSVREGSISFNPGAIKVDTANTFRLDITCSTPNSLNVNDISITLELNHTLLQLSNLDLDDYNKDLIGDPKFDDEDKPVYYTEVVIGKNSSITIPKLKAVAEGQDALIVTFNPGKVKASFAVSKFIVTFDRNDGDPDAVQQLRGVVTSGEPIDSLPKIPTRKGYNFVGWNTNKDATTGTFDETTPVTNDITVYAIWESESTTS